MDDTKKDVLGETKLEALALDEPEKVEAKVFRAAPRIAILGNVDAGKSTFVGCMTRNITDDGRGAARRFACSHKHEADMGRTSAVSIYPVGFDTKGSLVGVGVSKGAKGTKSSPDFLSRKDLWTRIGERADKLAFLVDLCGHEKYLKTTCKGLTSQDPHFACMVVAANEDAGRIVDGDLPRNTKRKGGSKSRNMTRQHMGILTGLDLPTFIVVTKIDLAPPQVFKTNMQRLGRMLRERSSCEPRLIKTSEEAVKAAHLIMGGTMLEIRNAKGKLRKRKPVPVLCVSSVTGQGREALVRFLYTLQVPGKPKPTGIKVDGRLGTPALLGLELKASTETETDLESKDGENDVLDLADWSVRDLTTGLGPKLEEAKVAELGIDSIYLKISGVALVVAGTVRNGAVYKGQELLMGPDSRGEFCTVTVRSIQVQYKETDMIVRGQTAGIALRLKKSDEMKPKTGMYLVAPELKRRPTKFFLASVKILHHRSTIKRGYIMTINTGPICRAARVVKLRKHETDPETGTIKMDTPDLPEITTGDQAIIGLKFLRQGEILHAGDQILSREGDAKATGFVLHCFETPKDFQRYRDLTRTSEAVAALEDRLIEGEEIRRKRGTKGKKRPPLPAVASIEGKK